MKEWTFEELKSNYDLSSSNYTNLVKLMERREKSYRYLLKEKDREIKRLNDLLLDYQLKQVSFIDKSKIEVIE